MAEYYELLGVSREADADDIKKAYRKLALQYHPDRNNGSKEAEERFKEVTEAYETLKDPEKRAAYDRYGKQGVRGAGARGGARGFDFADAIEIFMRDFGAGGGMGGLEDLFGMSGAQTRRSSRSAKGQTARLRLSLTLPEVASGVTKKLRVALLDSCETCDGSGAAPGSTPSPCGQCGGAGEVRHVQRSPLGQFVSVQPCRACAGEGRIIETPCTECSGEGRVRNERDIEVEVPPGVSSENFLTLRGQGNAGPRGGSRGDIVVLLEVEQDPRFRRDGADLLHELPITFVQAALGDEVDVPTVEGGSARMEIPAGIQSGETLRLRGLGLPELHGQGHGHLLVRVVVWTPQKLTDDEVRLLEELRELGEPAPDSIDRKPRKGFWSKVKEAFTGG